MRCFEIIVEPADEDQNVGINNNMRCFEILICLGKGELKDDKQ